VVRQHFHVFKYTVGSNDFLLFLDLDYTSYRFGKLNKKDLFTKYSTFSLIFSNEFLAKMTFLVPKIGPDILEIG
jgi:hypothetical protein